MKVKKVLFFSILILIGISQNNYSQEFDVKPLIQIPGDNKNFNVIQSDIGFIPYKKTYICWENRVDKLFSIYFKQIYPLDENMYVVWSDTNQNCNPVITSVYSVDSIVVVWQALRNNHWCLYSRGFRDSVFSNVNLLTDTLTNNITPSLSNEGLTWIQEGKLLYRQIFPNQNLSDSTVILDSNGCSNPKIGQDNDSYEPSIYYEKEAGQTQQIFQVSYMPHWVGVTQLFWNYAQLTKDSESTAPSFGDGFEGELCFQTKENGLWKIVWRRFLDFIVYKSNNLTCNYENPVYYEYPIPTKITAQPILGSFLVFDSDSLKNNKQILMFYARYPFGDTLINVSNLPGDNSKPMIIRLDYFSDHPGSYPDSAKIAIFWEHSENEKTDIWWGISPLVVLMGAVNDSKIPNNSFYLFQNYPNPFNPSTTISYQLPIYNFVTLKVYDILGRVVKTLINEHQSAGNHSVIFNANGLRSGVYFYRLTAGKFSDIKKLLYLK
jgi:hypothetical protein